jgi:hypothetical protein
LHVFLCQQRRVHRRSRIREPKSPVRPGALLLPAREGHRAALAPCERRRDATSTTKPIPWGRRPGALPTGGRPGDRRCQMVRHVNRRSHSGFDRTEPLSTWRRQRNEFAGTCSSAARRLHQAPGWIFAKLAVTRHRRLMRRFNQLVPLPCPPPSGRRLFHAPFNSW